MILNYIITLGYGNTNNKGSIYWSQLKYDIDKCSYCRIGNPVLIFENGRFPIISRNPWESEKCGLMLEFDGNLVSDISFCYIFLTTENPFNYEKQCKRHLD